MNSKEWLLEKLNFREDQLLSESRQKDWVQKRWVMVWFYRKAGKSFPYIAEKLGRNHQTIIHACKNATPLVKALAEHLLFEYITEVLKKKTDFEPFEEEKKKIKIKVPDYKNNITKFIEVDADSIKPMKKIRSWEL